MKTDSASSRPPPQPPPSSSNSVPLIETGRGGQEEAEMSEIS